MEIYVYTKDYFKESKEVREAILAGVKTLYERIHMYEQQNTDFERIFDNDYIKYDKHGKFYTFKCQKSNMQLRILYAYFIVDGKATVLIADYFIKKKNNKRYIRKFDYANSLEPMKAYQNSYYIQSAC